MRRSASILSAAVLTAAGFFLVSGDAHAQGTPSQPPADGVAPAPGAGGAAPAAPAGGAAAPAADDEHEDGRLRIGFNINGGLGTGGNLSGPVFGGTFRVGWQINRLMGAYANITPFVWVGSSSTTGLGGATADIGAIAGVQTAPMFSLTPIDLLEIAAGPSLDYLSGGGVSAGPGGTSVGGFSGMYFGINGRLALHLGGRNPDTGRRKGFTIGGDIHPTFTPGSAVTFFTLGLGADWY